MKRSGLVLVAALSIPARADIFTRLPSFLNGRGQFVEVQSIQRDAAGNAISALGSDKATYPMSVVEAGRVTVTTPDANKSYLTVSSSAGRESGGSVHVYRVFKHVVDRAGHSSFLVGTDQENQLVPVEQTSGANVKFLSKDEVLAKIDHEQTAKIEFGWNTLRVMAQSRTSSERTDLLDLLEAAQRNQSFAQTRTAARWLPALQRVLRVSPIVDARLVRALELPKTPTGPALTPEELVRQIPATAAE